MYHIVNNLWLGSQQDADELIRSNPENITAILNVRGPDAYKPPGRDQSSEHPGKAYKWIPAPDVSRVSPEHVREAVAWLEEQTARNHRILVHCKHGISRSPAFLAAFMVNRGISAGLEEAVATIAARCPIHPAAQIIIEPVKPVGTISELTGLPNREAFDKGRASPFTAIVNLDRMKVFNQTYGEMAGDALLCRLANILTSVGLDAYHDRGDEFLCKGDSREELQARLTEARRKLGEPFQMRANGQVHTIEEMDFSFGIGETPEERASALSDARARARSASPEWVRKIIASGGSEGLW